jgi:four helix bundle protein
MEIRSTHQNLVAWRDAMTLVVSVYHDTGRFPNEETYGLTAQMRRAAVSIPSNIAEGAARNSDKEWAHYLGIACGSAAELETQIDLAIRLGYLAADAKLLDDAARVNMLLRRLRNSVVQQHSR